MTLRTEDHLELYDSGGELVAVGWFDQFGIRRMIVDRALVEGEDRFQRIFVTLVQWRVNVSTIDLSPSARKQSSRTSRKGLAEMPVNIIAVHTKCNSGPLFTCIAKDWEFMRLYILKDGHLFLALRRMDRKANAPKDNIQAHRLSDKSEVFFQRT